MVSGLNEAVCHEEPVVSGSKAQSSVVSYSSKTDLTQSQGWGPVYMILWDRNITC